jgi:hypothetical protein
MKTRIQAWIANYLESRREAKEFWSADIRRLPGKYRQVKKMWDLTPPDVRRRRLKEALVENLPPMMAMIGLLYYFLFVEHIGR